MFKELFAQVSRPQKKWIAQVIGGAVMADEVIDPDERELLKKFLRDIDNDPQVSFILQTVFNTKVQPEPTPISFSPEMAEKVFCSILEFCASDHELQVEEVRYVSKVGKAIGFEQQQVTDMINKTMTKAKLTS